MLGAGRLRGKVYGPEERRHRLKAWGIFTQCGLRVAEVRVKVTAKSRDVSCEECQRIGGDRFARSRA